MRIRSRRDIHQDMKTFSLNEPVLTLLGEHWTEADWTEDPNVELEGPQLLPYAEFIECVEMGGFTDYDGFGEYATATHFWNNGPKVSPSDVIEDLEGGGPDARFTHILWYNR